MRTRSTLLTLSAVLCAWPIHADAQKAPPVARPTVRPAAAYHAPADPLLKAHRALSHSVVAPSRIGSALQRTVRPLPVRSAGKPMADQHEDPSLVRGTAPANDNCANATLLTVGSACAPTSGTVDQATQSIAAVDCATFVGNANDDVWYRFVATGPSVTIFLECNETFDGVIDLRSGACNGTNIDCMDGFIAGGSETLVATGLTAGTTYRFRVYDYEAGYPTDPSFSVCVYTTPEAPANDLCEDAIIQDLNVPGSVTVTGDNTGATDSEGFDAASVWEAFTIGECADITISYCGTDPFFGNAFLNLILDCSLAESIPWTDFETTSCGDENITITYNDVPAGTYYYAVLMDASAMGAYTIEFSAVACGGGGGTPPNDQCFNVVPEDLSSGSSVFFDGTTENATSTNDGSSLDVGGDTVTVWHAFTTTECTNLAVSYCGTAVSPASYWAVLFEGCPANDAGFLFSEGNFDDCSDGNATIFFYEVPAGTWYLPVRGEPATWGTYTIEVSATACASAGPYCEAGAAIAGFETIGNVVFAGIDNTSTTGAVYEDFTSVSATVMQGQSYPIDITVDDGFTTDQALVWIDFDQSDSFEESELVFTSTNGAGPYSGTVAIPLSAATGATRMRIRLHDTHDGTDYQNTPNYTPCDTSTYGQVEDYSLVITTGGGGDFNDECSDATPLLLTAGASISFTGNNTGCTDTEGLEFNNSWEAFTINECMDVTWDFCGSVDGMLVYTNLWTGCPYENFSRSCGDTPDIICPNENTSPQASALGLPPGTYYIIIPNDSIYGGQYQINVTGTACTTPAPVNDECGGAIALTPASDCVPVSGTTAGATRSLPDLECNGFTGTADDDVWYAFTATTPGGDIVATPTEELDLVVQLYSGVCGGFTPLNCADDGLLGEEEVLTYADLTVGTTYYYRVYGYYLGQHCDGFFSTCVVQDISTGLTEGEQAAMLITPNPTEGQVTVRADVVGTVRLEILDVAGRLVQTEQRVATSGPMTIDLSDNVGAGIYTLRLTTPDQRLEQRLLVR